MLSLIRTTNYPPPTTDSFINILFNFSQTRTYVCLSCVERITSADVKKPERIQHCVRIVFNHMTISRRFSQISKASCPVLQKALFVISVLSLFMI
jgi:hypothetical protein